MKAPALWTATVALLAVPATALAQQNEPPYYGHHMWDGDWHGWFFGPLSMLLLLAAVVVVAVVIGRRLGPTPPAAGPGGKTPLDILKERFARGEIDKAEYEERRRVLED